MSEMYYVRLQCRAVASDCANYVHVFEMTGAYGTEGRVRRMLYITECTANYT